MTTPTAATTQERPAVRRRRGRPSRFLLVLVTALALLFGVPWAVLVLAPSWPTPVTILGTVAFGVALVSFVPLMVFGHGRGHDWAARVGDTMLGVVWIVFTWTVLSNVARPGL